MDRLRRRPALDEHPARELESVGRRGVAVEHGADLARGLRSAAREQMLLRERRALLLCRGLGGCLHAALGLCDGARHGAGGARPEQGGGAGEELAAVQWAHPLAGSFGIAWWASVSSAPGSSSSADSAPAT